jgi:DNA-binding SARP family transcriptional activator
MDDRTASAALELRLLGGFALLRRGRVLPLPISLQRTLAFLALRGPAPRRATAGLLWPSSPDDRAMASLRTAVWRLRRAARGLLTQSGELLALDAAVRIDVALIDSGAGTRRPAATGRSCADLLPGWYDDWALLEAENWRQLRLHALETLADNLITGRRYAEAIAAAHAAVHADPLRESGQACLIRAHLAEGNPSEALHDFARYARRLRDELGLEPTARLRHMVTDLSPVKTS